MKRKQPIPLMLAVVFLLAVPCCLPAQSVTQQRRQERLNQALIDAVKRNDKSKVVVLLFLGANANCHDESDKTEAKTNPSPAPTPLLLALRWKDKNRVGEDDAFSPENPPLVKALLDHKADVNVRDNTDNYQNTLLFYAIEAGKQATVHLLLKYGADIKPDSRHDFAPLVAAAIMFPTSIDVLSDMLHRGANVNQRSSDGETALLRSVQNQNIAAVRLLLSYHADVTLQANKLNEGNHITPLAQATIEWEIAHRLEDNQDRRIAEGFQDIDVLDMGLRDLFRPTAEAEQIIKLLQQAGAKE